jgi:hypothetical protein
MAALKKDVQKEGWCEMKFYDVSPLAAMITGQGAMGKAMQQGFGGMIPAAIARSGAKSREEEEREKRAADASTTGVSTQVPSVSAMKRGGAVKKQAKKTSAKSSASKRADGCATKGKTRGRMV